MAGKKFTVMYQHSFASDPAPMHSTDDRADAEEYVRTHQPTVAGKLWIESGERKPA